MLNTFKQGFLPSTRCCVLRKTLASQQKSFTIEISARKYSIKVILARTEFTAQYRRLKSKFISRLP